MVDQGAPQPDPFGGLFGPVRGFHPTDATPSAPPAAQVPTAMPPTGLPPTALPSRRALRGGGESQRVTPVQPPASRTSPSSAARNRSRGRGSAKLALFGRRTDKGAPQPFVKPIDSAYPVNRVLVVRRAAPAAPKPRRGSKAFTILAVVGLFGSVAAPAAYAFTPRPSAQETVSAVGTTGLSLKVSQNVVLANSSRGGYSATSANDLAQQRSSALKSSNYAAYMTSGARDAGDDYPWFSELSVNQGGGLSPLNYFYRECVDFVAWRINRDAGYTKPPFKWVWSNLTPTGGNASQWRYAWQAHGWKTSTKPVVGAVAWFYGNHVGYVNAVNDDGTIVMEDYNHEATHLYAKRTIPISDVALFLYPPPANG